MSFPKEGLSRSDVATVLRDLRHGDADWHAGRTFSLVYFAGEDVLAVLRDAYQLFIHENGLSLDAFPSLRKMETELLGWCCELFGGGPASAASLTSGGTESILMAVKTARDAAARATPNLVLPVSAHPAFDKAAHYLGVAVRKVPLRADLRADVDAMAAAIDGDTVLVVGSAYGFPHGVVDDIPAIAALAQSRGVPCHVDACLGGFILAFEDEPVPFDLRVPGVTSLSADLHKYGYAAKGSSVVVYADRSYRRHQFFAATDWPGGLYGSPTLAGTRPGGGIAAAWAVLRHLGRDGYAHLTRVVLHTAAALRAAIAGTPGLRLLGDGRHSVIAFTGDDLDVYAVDEGLRERGWHLDRLQNPNGLQMIVTPAHVQAASAFEADLAEVTAAVRDGRRTAGSDAAVYGALATLPDRAMVQGFVLDWLDLRDRPQEG